MAVDSALLGIAWLREKKWVLPAPQPGAQALRLRLSYWLRSSRNVSPFPEPSASHLS